jgi:hypothetical protein
MPRWVARARLGSALACTVLVGCLPAGGAVGGETLAPAEARTRVEHHLRSVDDLSRHFDEVLTGECPRFATSAEWDQFVDGEVNRMALLVAHVEEAWAEARRTGDDDVRREAKAPRKRVNDARGLVAKLSGCAERNGIQLAPMVLWSRIEREVPRRREEIALPQ